MATFSSVSQLEVIIADKFRFIKSLGFSPDDIKTMHLPPDLEVADYKRTSINKKPLYKVARSFALDFHYSGKHFLLLISKNTLTNLATVPWLLQWILKADDRYVKEAAIAHDVITDEFEQVHNKGYYNYVLIDLSTMHTRITLSRWFSDIIFRELIEESIRRNARLNNRTAKVKAAIAYAGVSAWYFISSLFK